MLFLEGLSWWLIAYAGTLAGLLAASAPQGNLLLTPIAVTLLAAAGAYALRARAIDPLFRRLSDIFFVLGTFTVIALITPSFASLALLLNEAWAQPTLRDTLPFWPVYVSTLASLVVVTPFLLRWLAKPRFARRGWEIVEVVGLFAFLLGIEYFIFYTDVAAVAGISLTYFLLPPLLWIALRLRPRFVTLALVLSAALDIGSLFRHALPSGAFGTRLFSMDLWFIVFAIVFLVIAALEEERRVTATLARSQVATMQNALARLSSESRAKNDFIAILAHELRNPLAPVASAIELLKTKKLGKREEAQTLALMEDRMETVKRLLNDLLDVSRISERKIRLEKEPVDLHELAQRAIDSTAHHYKERHQTLNVVPPTRLLAIDADPVRMEQVLSNLLTNASKYSPTSSDVRLILTEENGRAKIVVADRGVGIDPAHLSRIFEPFHQVEMGERTKAGLGIGLALVKSFVEMHEGTVAAESQGPGKGTRFIVSLPLSTSTPLRKARKGFTLERASAGGRKILVVDDNDAAAWGVGKLLELQGCAVDYAYDGAQALERAGERTYDVVILDIGLPDQSGHDVARALRARGYRGTLIALTGYSLEEEKAKGEASGFDDYLVKPVGLADLQRALTKLS